MCGSFFQLGWKTDNKKNTRISIKEAEPEGLIVSISPMAQKSYNPSSCNNFLQSVSVYTHTFTPAKKFDRCIHAERKTFILPFGIFIILFLFASTYLPIDFFYKTTHTRGNIIWTLKTWKTAAHCFQPVYISFAYNNTFCDTFNLGFLGHEYSQVIIISITLNVTCSCVLLLYCYL